MNWLLLSMIGALGVYTGLALRSLAINIYKARQTGLEYVVTPVYIFEPFWMVSHGAAATLLKYLPAWFSGRWVQLVMFDEMWRAGHRPFTEIGVDTFLAVSPWKIVMYSCDDTVISYITQRVWQFPNPTPEIGMLNIFGPSIGGTIGREHRNYRKIASRAYTDETHERVWKFALDAALDSVERWKEAGRVEHLEPGLRRLTLSAVGVGLLAIDPRFFRQSLREQQLLNSQENHVLTFQECQIKVVKHINTIVVLPHWFLAISPFASHRQALRAFKEWRQYANGLLGTRDVQIKQGADPAPESLLSNLIRAEHMAGEKTEQIQRDAVLGNIFFQTLAGSHTTALTLEFALTILALRPDVQRTLQAQLDQVFTSSDRQDWNFQDHFHKLLCGYMGAFVHEVLRIYGVLPFATRCTLDRPMPLVVDGGRVLIPAHTYLLLNTSATHRNPKYWPTLQPGPGECYPWPIHNFDPTQWLTSSETDQGSSGRDGSPLARVAPGTMIPFSQGPRKCLGMRFALVELCAVLGSIFKEYDVQLSVKDIHKATSALGKRALLEETHARALMGMTDLDFSMAYCLTRSVPVEFVKRGTGQFLD